MPRQTKIHVFAPFILLLLSLWVSIGLAGNWRTIAPGIEYLDLADRNLVPWSHIHVFRVDLNKQKLDVATAKHLSKKNASVEDLTQAKKALIGINGGFFDTEYKPLGLRVGDHHQYSRLKSISWWGVFYIIDNKAYLSNYSQYKAHHEHVDFAIQSGPRLLIDGKPPKLKPGIAERTALGITQNGRVILLATERSAMTTATLAGLMASAPLSCEQALNLDGGSSTQMFAQIGLLNINTHGLSNVSDAVIVKPYE